MHVTSMSWALVSVVNDSGIQEGGGGIGKCPVAMLLKRGEKSGLETDQF